MGLAVKTRDQRDHDMSVMQHWGYRWLILFCAVTAATAVAQDNPVSLDSSDIWIAQARRLDHQVVAAYEAGQYKQGLGRAMKALRLYQNAHGENHPLVASAAENVAELLIRLRQYQKALPYQQQALEIRKSAFGESHLLVVATLNKLGFLHSRRAHLETADSLFQGAFQTIERKHGNDHPDLVPIGESLRNLAVLYEAKGNLPKARSLYWQALTILENTLDPHHATLAKLTRDLRVLAMLYEKQGKLSEADSLYQSALSRFKNLFSEDDPEVLRAAENLREVADAYLARGNRIRSETLYNIAYGVIKNTLGTDHPDLKRFAFYYRHIARAYRDADDLEAAWRLYDIGLEKLRNVVAADQLENALFAGDYRELGHRYLQRGRLDDSEKLYQQNHAMMIEVLGENHLDLANYAWDFLALGNACRDVDRLSKARDQYDVAHNIVSGALGEDHPDNARIAAEYRELGRRYQAKDDLYYAETLFDTNLSIMKKVLGENDPGLAPYAQDYRDLGKLYLYKADVDYAKRLYDTFQSLIKETLGANHPSLAQAGQDYRDAAAQFLESDSLSEWIEPLCRTAIDLFRSLEGDYAQDILQTTDLLIHHGEALEAAGGGQNALEIYEYVLYIDSVILGDSHPDVTALQARITALRGQKIERYYWTSASQSGSGTGMGPSRPDRIVDIASPSANFPDAPVPAPTVTVTRYPTMRAPQTVAPGATFVMQISLTRELITREVEILEGESTESGQVVMNLPDRLQWDIDVIISAPQLKIPDGRNVGTITLTPQGDSNSADFELTVPAAGCAPSRTTLYATLWHEGAFLAKIARKLYISDDQPLTDADGENVAGAARESLSGQGIAPVDGNRTQPEGNNAFSTMTVASGPGANQQVSQSTGIINLEASYSAPDLTLWILKEAYTDENDGVYQLQINSPYLQPFSGTFQVKQPTSEWMGQQQVCIARGAKPLTANTNSLCQPFQSREQNVDRLSGFGKLLYQKIAPPDLRQALESLLAIRGDKFQSIQIYTNNPGIPWELMHTDKAMPGFETPGFLGTRFRIARWHISGNQNLLNRPPQSAPMNELVLVSPRYEGRMALPSQQVELAELQQIQGYRSVKGQYSPLKQLFGNYPAGIIHFAGHGEVRKDIEGNAEYVILLEDAKLDLMTWRGFTAFESSNHPFVFFNACEIGQSQRVANFVDGWAPAILESGASGYVGGLWPLSDASAAAFAVNFYRALDQGLQNGAVNVADLLRDNRRRFAENGDPTFLAYVYYGDPNFAFRR